MYKNIDGTRLSIGFQAPQFVYGEMKSMDEYLKIFSYSANLTRSCVFCDLGSGVGKANFVVASMFPVNRSIGIELIPRMHDLSLAQKELFDRVILPILRHKPRIVFSNNDITKNTENWLYSDVIFLNSLTWEKKVIKTIKKQLERLKPGTEIFASTVFKSKSLALSRTIDANMNWGSIPIYLYIKVPNR
jgi:predicted RNA methylase